MPPDDAPTPGLSGPTRSEPSPLETTGPEASNDGTKGARTKAPKPKASKRGVLLEALIVVVVALLAAVLLRTFVVQTYYIPSGSMEPTLEIGDRILVSKLSYDFHSIDRNDIVVFARPPAEDCGGAPVPDLVKRVIGLPGDRISSVGNTVLIDGKPLAEPYLPPNTPLGHPIASQVVPANSYFVMGDNRPESCDSRYWGVVPRSLIVGKVVARIWPLSALHWF